MSGISVLVKDTPERQLPCPQQERAISKPVGKVLYLELDVGHVGFIYSIICHVDI
jgi:hypothetical protein